MLAARYLVRALPLRVPTAHLSTSTVEPMAAVPDVLFYTEWNSKGRLQELLQERGLHVATPEDITNWENITFAACWNPPPGLLGQCPNLRAAMSLGAGVDRLVGAGQVPDQVPILRIVDPLMAARMATWVAWGVIDWQRRMGEYAAAQRQRQWALDVERGRNRDNCDVRVGVMGFGLMGRTCAEMLDGMGYRVSIWSRSPKQRKSIMCYAGANELRGFVSQQDVLVCLLPLTPSTAGIVNADLLRQLPRGSAFINGARGQHVVEDDLLAALEGGQLEFALLDVFQTEPLPQESPLWLHPRVRITPHAAAHTALENAADQIAANYRSIAAGEGPLQQYLVDRQHGY